MVESAALELAFLVTRWEAVLAVRGAGVLARSALWEELLGVVHQCWEAPTLAAALGPFQWERSIRSHFQTTLTLATLAPFHCERQGDPKALM